ncbi:MAG: DUF3256 family protein [Muribaculaceae bacterium]|nr:DUF3256 family protein [Muribaculaceae bacterium]
MNRKLTVFAVAATAAAAFMPFGIEARTAADFFKQAPQSVIPVLAVNTRLDMLDYYNSGMFTPVANRVNGKSTLSKVDDMHLKVELSENSSLQLAVIPMKKDTVIAVIETVKCPVADSGIRFYRAKDWSEIDVPAHSPSVTEFVAPDKRKQAVAGDLPRFAFSNAEFVPEKNVFVFHNTTADFYHDTDKPAGLELMQDLVAMRFDGRKLVEVKSYK